jgi:hypothetical protein
MARKREAEIASSKPAETPRFSVNFSASGDSMEELHKKMGKAFGSRGERKRTGKKHGHRDSKHDMKKGGGKRS